MMQLILNTEVVCMYTAPTGTEAPYIMARFMHVVLTILECKEAEKRLLGCVGVETRTHLSDRRTR